MNGRRSSTRKRLTEAYADSTSKCEASNCVTLLQGVSSGGVTFFQFLPPSRVTQSRPSSVPAQIVSMLLKDGASEYTTPRCFAAFGSFAAIVPNVEGMPGSGRVRSG